MEKGTERRAYERVVLQRPVVLVGDDGTESSGTSIDLSEGGVLVLSRITPPVGARLRVRLRLPYGMICVPVSVRRHCRVRGGRAFGAQFVEPSPHARDILRRSMAEFLMQKALPRVAEAPRPRKRTYEEPCFDRAALCCDETGGAVVWAQSA